MILIAVLVAIALVAAFGYWLRLRPSPARAVPTGTRTARTAERFAAVAICPGSGACEAAHALDEQRFLAHQAPALPLVGCTKTRCGCSFTKLSDRRAESRRWGLVALSAAMFTKTERRKRAGRRDAD